MIRSVRGRLILSYVLFTILTISLLGIFGLSLVKRSMEAQEIEFLTLNAEGIASEAAPLLWPIPRFLELQEIAESAAFLSDTRVKIFGIDHVPVADSGHPNEFSQFVFIFPPLEIPIETPDGRLGTLFMKFPINGSVGSQDFPPTAFEMLERFPPETRYTIVERFTDYWGGRIFFEPQIAVEPEWSPARSGRILSLPISRGDQTLGYVEISQGPNFTQEALETMQRALFIAAGGVVLLAGILGLFAARWMTDPLRGLAEAARRMGDGDLTIRAPIDQTAEIREVASQFNHMAASLESSFSALSTERDTLKRFIADASHELRTPITALRNFNELLLDYGEQDEKARHDFILESQQQIVRLEWITNNLLDLSRLDAGLASLDLEFVDIGELLDDVIRSYAQVAVEKGVFLDLSALDQEIIFECDRSRMGLAVGNLVENAIKFNNAAGKVFINYVLEADRLLITVKDTGVGIDVEEMPLIYDRFYRGRGHKIEGSGLGLAIVKSVVEAHGGHVELESVVGVGSQFTLIFPHNN